ncbi:argininosuccinate lyase [Anopheles sinensis]|uniref:Argininosuccinate lyase n=1 Tax=Anopheles sinensis TaxID=74873 RepID=A0A084VAV0_ANOSI|nr:argininosuccinate lyase [Anopheles sinensis]
MSVGDRDGFRSEEYERLGDRAPSKGPKGPKEGIHILASGQTMAGHHCWPTFLPWKRRPDRSPYGSYEVRT